MPPDPSRNLAPSALGHDLLFLPSFATVGKTDRTLLERVKEHAYKDQESAVNKHLNSCYDTNYLDSKTNNELTDFVMTNSKIIDSSNNWNLLLYKEALHIKRPKSILNNGLKASRDLQLFN